MCFKKIHCYEKRWKQRIEEREGKSGTTWNRTRDTRIFSPLLYRLSYGTLSENWVAKIISFFNFEIIFLTQLQFKKSINYFCNHFSINSLQMNRFCSNNNQNDQRLIIDFGNTLTKAAIFVNDKIVDLLKTSELTVNQLKTFTAERDVKYVFSSAVIDVSDDVNVFLKNSFQYLTFDHHTLLPIINLYKTPATLGKDRLSMAVAAADQFPEQNCLIVSAGTTITYDFVDSEKRYHGGAISPGLTMRLKALHTYTSKLPLISLKADVELTGNTTENSILSGVIWGAIAEVDKIIDYYKASYTDLLVIFSGGDVNIFHKKLKNCIFVAENLVLTGLNAILNFNVNRQ